MVGDIGQPSVARAERRAVTRREVPPDGLLAPDDALEGSGLRPAKFLRAVREGRIRPMEVFPNVWAFRPEDVDSHCV